MFHLICRLIESVTSRKRVSSTSNLYSNNCSRRARDIIRYREVTGAQNERQVNTLIKIVPCPDAYSFCKHRQLAEVVERVDFNSDAKATNADKLGRAEEIPMTKYVAGDNSP